MLIVAEALAESLFNYWSPNCAIIAQLRVQSVILFASLSQGQVVVDNDGLGEAKSVNIDPVDPSWTQLILVVQKEFFDTAWELCKSCYTRNKPTVSYKALHHVLRPDTIFTKKGRLGKNLTCPFPLNVLFLLELGHSALRFPHCGPIKRLGAWLEFWVFVHSLCVVKLVKFVYRPLQAI